MMDAERMRHRVFPGGVGRERHGRLRPAVIRVAQGDDVIPPREHPGRQDGHVVGLAAAVGEIRHLQAGRHLGGQLLAVQPDGRVDVDRRGVLQPADLLADPLDLLGMAMADGNGDDAADGVEVPLTLLVIEVLHVTLDDHDGLFVILHDGRREEFASEGQRFLGGRTRVRAGGVIAGRQRQLSGIRGHITSSFQVFRSTIVRL